MTNEYGFEIPLVSEEECKLQERIEELEHQLTHRNCLDCSNHSSKLRMRNLDLEKENTELQEENGKLLQRIIQLEEDVIENESDCSMCDFPKLKQDLEKENATLKKQLEVSSGDVPWSGLKDVSEVIKQLTEAKELLKQWLKLYNTNTVKGIIADTEQFLNGDGCPDTLCEDCTKEDCTVRKLGLVEK